MRTVDLIRKKRDGGELTADQIRSVVNGYTNGEISDYQMSAWLMAVLLRGMTGAELAALTEAMLFSGDVLNLSAIAGKKVDKHSTGGVGDKTSLVLAPLVAAGGLIVPMISGRGLGHTGGTLDKLEAIPGFNVNLSLTRFRALLDKIGCAMIGQTAEIAPADKKIYALRDVSGTVESPNLICASIMSKKLAEGIDALVLDVKTGSGAFMKREEDAVHLAELMIETGTRMGKNVVALITDMDQPLGRNVGNAMEVLECLDVLRGGGPADLRELCLDLAGWMFFVTGMTAEVSDGRGIAERLISMGKALDKFREMVREQGGDENIVDDRRRLPSAQHKVDVTASRAGAVRAMNCEAIGTASVVLGGGREKKEDVVDPAVGIVVHKKIGEPVEAGEPLCTLHYNSSARLREAQQLVADAYCIEAGEAFRPRPLVRRVLQPKVAGRAANQA
jgi:pyrimidine-nucleoside phosphorylase/thymidine phosphorylase